MWELRHTLFSLAAAVGLLGCGDSGQTGSATCVGTPQACACQLLGWFGPTVVTATVSEIDEAGGTVVLDVDSVERPYTIPGSGSPAPIETAPPGWHVTGTYQQIDLARAKEYASCGSEPAPAVGERVLAGFDLSSSGFSCPGCVRDMDCNVFCPPLGAAATLRAFYGIRLLPDAGQYDFAGTVLSQGEVIAMSPGECSSRFPDGPTPMCESDIVGADDGAGCALAPTSGAASSSAWYVLVLVLGAIRRRRRQGTHWIWTVPVSVQGNQHASPSTKISS
jgi:MYXO-CTERM domain-containing protein